MKGIWGIVFSLPVIVITMFTRNPQVIVTYTGGICGTFILFLFPVMIVSFARRHEKRQQLQSRSQTKEDNFNASIFQHFGFIVLVTSFAIITLVFVIMGIA